MPDFFSRKVNAYYDPFGTVVRLMYDPEEGTNLLDDPAYIHEIAHYGQNLMTRVGIEQTIIGYELYVATVTLLMNEPDLRLPLLSQYREGSSSSSLWRAADLPLYYMQTVIGDSSLPDDVDARKAQLVANKSAYNPDSPNPFHLSTNPPTVSVLDNDSPVASYHINGLFIQELHARSTEYFIRYANAKLNSNEATTYFLHAQNCPPTLLYAAAQKAITDKVGQSIMCPDESVLLCHICTYLTLMAGALVEEGLPAGLPGLGLHGCLDLGVLFVVVFSKALGIYSGLGCILRDYFGFMDALTADLGWGQSSSLLSRTDEWVNEILASFPPSTRHASPEYPNAIYAKLLESSRCLKLLARYQSSGDFLSFVRAPALARESGTASGPIVAGPHGVSWTFDQYMRRQTEDQFSMALWGWFSSFITTTLWNTDNLYCEGRFARECWIQNLDGEACTNFTECPSRACDNVLWMQLLKRYPGLNKRLNGLMASR